ncbi:ATP-binding cassette domain-containing protein [Pseudarthrobacter sp. SSS035]|uniref:ATP-binding cassette domain-containing protein n=1 Tax=Pseudarthrobacter sp. SSS035 TaxID=2931399 RepID=UPI00200FF524|nr:ATP-binding cassette domain-containing protein [Pseudarthrobacter sp. SSS035]
MTDPFIHLENLTKTFPGCSEPAVDNLDLRVRKGEIVMLVGPSGCGKTTTMKMINRLVEPTSGRIIIDGQDVTDVDPNELRRSIGYVIQQGGLFPHRRVGDNVAAVLKLLKWPSSKIPARVDEMLDLVGLDPSQYRDRYPKQLSGGQRQRVGVARALAADPPIMLLDEPFGAVDPIARERLQDEFLRLQKEICKTIVFVTHDLSEAVKMGDRIAIVRDRSAVAQFDTPAQILANPANDFVRDFLGENAELRALSLLEVKAEALTVLPTTTVQPGEAEQAQTHGAATVVLEAGRPVGWLLVDGASRRFRPVDPLRLGPSTRLADALGQMMRSGAPAAILVGEDGRLAGCLEFAAVTRAVASTSGGALLNQRRLSEELTYDHRN